MTEAELAAWLLTVHAAMRFDLLTIRTHGGTVLRWTNADVPFTLADGRVFEPGPNFERSRLTLGSDLSVDNMDLTLHVNANHQVAGVPILAFAQRGGLDGAMVTVEWLWTTSQGVVQGWHTRFSGTTGPAQCERGRITASVRSETARLGMAIPTQVYQPGCLNTVYDTQCALSKAAWTVVSSVSAHASNSTTRFYTPSGAADGYFDLGVVTFTAGALAGQSRSIKAFIGGHLYVSTPWPSVPAAGDAFTMRRGCDGSITTCTSVFNNRARFRGEPWVPAPETAA